MRKLVAEHGMVCALGSDFFGYFGWPSVALMDDGTLVAVASGLRNEHVCPFGRTTMFLSHDEGRTWTSPRVVNDSPCDDRDAGVVPLGGKKLLITWFTSDNRESSLKTLRERGDDETLRAWMPGYQWISDENASRWTGSWIRVSNDGGETWSPPVKVLVSTPHGPIRLRSGELLYFGKEFGMSNEKFGDGTGRILAMESTDDGSSWEKSGEVPIFAGSALANYHEPHVVELPSGTLVGHIRFQSFGGLDVTELGITDFSLMQTESTDGGKTWTTAHPLGFHGSPPHLIRHSSGALVCAYGYRMAPYGQRVAISDDEGATWEHDFILRDDGPDWDLGYPASVELADGSIFTLYYQKVKAGEKCGVLWSRWCLP